MMTLAHVTSAETPTGTLLLLIGFFSGVFATWALCRIRAG